MNVVLTIICAVAVVWRCVVAGGIVYDRIKTGVPSPTLNVILWDSILIIIIAANLLAKLW